MEADAAAGAQDLPEEVAATLEEVPEAARDAYLAAYTHCAERRELARFQLHTLRSGVNSPLDAAATKATPFTVTKDGQIPTSDALKRYQDFQQEWADFEERIQAATGRQKEDLVMSRTMFAHEKNEILNALQLSIPLQERHGADQWSMSLRDSWTRYVPVGNIFSGLFCPVEDKPEGGEVEIVHTRMQLSGQEGEHLKHAGKTAMIARSLKARGRSWVDSEFLKHRRKQYSGRLAKILPHMPEEGLVVEGKSVDIILAEQAGKPITLEEVEKQLETINAEAWETIVRARAERAEDEMASTLADTALSLAIGEAKFAAEQGTVGPCLSVSAPTLAIECLVGRVGRGSVAVTNEGTTALYFQWSSVKREGLPHAAGGAGGKKFFLSDQVNSILPGQTRDVAFSFKSFEAGVFEEVWEVTTRPQLPEGALRVIVRGTCVVEDTHSLQRESLMARLNARHQKRLIAEEVERLIRKVPEPPPPQKGDLGPSGDQMTFFVANGDLGHPVYYSPEVYAELGALWQEASEALNPPPEEAEEAAEPAPEAEAEEAPAWDGSFQQIGDMLGAIDGDAVLSGKFRRLLERAKVPGQPADMLVNAAYKALLAAADGVEAGLAPYGEVVRQREAAAAAEAEAEGAPEGEPTEPAPEAEGEGGAGGEESAKEGEAEAAEGEGTPPVDAEREEALAQVHRAVRDALAGVTGHLEAEMKAVKTVLEDREATAKEVRETADDKVTPTWDIFTYRREAVRLLGAPQVRKFNV